MDANISRWRGLCIAVIRGAISCCVVLGVGPHRANLKIKKNQGSGLPGTGSILPGTGSQTRPRIRASVRWLCLWSPAGRSGPGALILSFLRPWGRPRTPWGNYISWLAWEQLRALPGWARKGGWAEGSLGFLLINQINGWKWMKGGDVVFVVVCLCTMPSWCVSPPRRNLNMWNTNEAKNM